MSAQPMLTHSDALLPSGFYDILAPEAGHIEAARRTFQEVFERYGYMLVTPPLADFDAGDAPERFRLMDQESQRLIALRDDMTPQVVRLAATRLKTAPRPLRLCYSGDVLRARGSQLRPVRQFTQVGAELIGVDNLHAESEVVVMALHSLEAAGVRDVSVDFALPRLMDLVLKNFLLSDAEADLVRAALLTRDRSALASLDDSPRRAFEVMLDAVGPASEAIATLQDFSFGGQATAMVAHLDSLIDMVKAAYSDAVITVDPCETLGFGYKSGVAFSLFAKSADGELGRGGRYKIADEQGAEVGIGFSLYLDRVLGVLNKPAMPQRIYAPVDADADFVSRLRQDGHRVVCDFDAVTETGRRAQQLGCSHIIMDGGVVAVANILED